MNFVGQAPGRRPGTIMMRDGRYIHPLELESKDLRIDYILHGLPNICRFTGSIAGATWGGPARRAWRFLTNRTSFYSVAQHSTLGARWILETVPGVMRWNLARWFALHDAIEFASGDVSRPIKYQPEMQFFRDAEDAAMLKLARRFGLSWPVPEAIKTLDDAMLATEVRDLQGDAPWQGLPDPLPFRIEPWSPGRSFVEYRKILTELGLWR